MEYLVLPTEIQEINQLLRDHFGIDSEGTEAIWRVSWANDQYEKRRSKFTPTGVEMIHEEVFTFPKYQWCKDRWILERLVVVPEVNSEELLSAKKSYECIWKFEDRLENPVQPTFEACKFVIDVVYAAMGKSSLRKYNDPEAENPIEAKKERVDKLVEELFGDESSLLGRTVTGEAIAMPQNYVKEN